MKLQHYHNDSRDYEQYYLQQVGNGLPVFHGARVQKGHGLGNILGGLFRSAMPLFQRGLRRLEKKLSALELKSWRTSSMEPLYVEHEKPVVYGQAEGSQSGRHLLLREQKMLKGVRLHQQLSLQKNLETYLSREFPSCLSFTNNPASEPNRN
ncbi:hypothetical protein HOLleu_40415 [Holothuria leucospilota]|uniref:Uncharacterized protein n=1 Tax=Holothuria leucospilota TaxID=206669 RepID=A0A9Q0YFR8_HOLLE|nr:hypothetical protein HOLleu_40415 [Holothuria leucospilota]